MTDVSGRWALVTGASRGIGFLAAECLARHGCNLILHSRREEHLDKIVKAATTCGVQVRTVAAELSNITDMEDMLRRIDGMGVPVDIVLNNAGMQIAYRQEPLLTPASDYEQSFWVNTIAPMMITYLFSRPWSVGALAASSTPPGASGTTRTRPGIPPAMRLSTR